MPLSASIFPFKSHILESNDSIQLTDGGALYYILYINELCNSPVKRIYSSHGQRNASNYELSCLLSKLTFLGDYISLFHLVQSSQTHSMRKICFLKVFENSFTVLAQVSVFSRRMNTLCFTVSLNEKICECYFIDCQKIT